MSIQISSTLAPIPGDVAGIKSIAAKFQRTAESIDGAIDELKKAILNAKSSDSDAVEAVQGSAEQVSERLLQLKGRYTTAGTELTTFATDLETAQTHTQSLLTQRDQWEQQLMNLAAQQSRHSEDSPSVGSPDYLAKLVDHRQEAARLNTAVSGANEQLRQLQNRYANVVDQLRSAASRAAGQLRGAIKSDGLNDSTWKKFSNWVSEHADVLKAIHNVLGAITGVLGVLTLFFPVLAPIALVAAGLTAGLGLVLALTGEISWVDFALDIVGVLTMGVAAVAGKALKGVMTSLKATRVNNLTALGARSPLRSVTGSFNGVLKGKNGLKIGPLQLPSKQWLLEIQKFKGVNAAHFMRIALRGRAGAGGAADAALLKQGKNWITANRVAQLINTVLGKGDSVVTDTAPGISERLREQSSGTGFEDIATTIDDYTDAISDAYSDFKEQLTWKVGS